MKKPNGIILYEGPSKIDGKPIVAIATNIVRKSQNAKTGDLIQTWILRSHIDPWKAKLCGKDKSVCGDCKHRKFATCYVELVRNGPCAIYKAYKRGSYAHLNKTNIGYFSGRKIRLGAYGEPAAVPAYIWKKILKNSTGHTGYTHAWRYCAPSLKNVCMASVDTEKEAEQAKRKGWRTFRVLLPWENKTNKDEFVCPASVEKGKKTSCEKCLACGGLTSKTKKNPVILPHGSFGRATRFSRIMRLKLNKKKWTHLVPKIFRNSGK